MNSRLHLPVLRPSDVIPHLADPGHFKFGRSGRLIPEAWFKAPTRSGLPIMVEHVLNSVERFHDVILVEAFLERRIELRDGLRPSQADVLAILSLEKELAIMAVEGKVDESFGPLVGDWVVGRSEGRSRRLEQLCATLELAPVASQKLRYQLMHRTAAAIYEAQRYRAKIAVMMVHSFSPDDVGSSDFIAFASAIGFSGAEPTRLVGPVIKENLELYLGWTADLPSNEGFSIVNGRKSDAEFFGDD